MTNFVFSEKPIQIERGEDVYLYDTDDNAYLDVGASYACTPVGHSHPKVVEAASAQLERLMYVQASYPTEVRSALYDRLSSVAPGDVDNVWLCNSGTEANEAALKFARHATGRERIIAVKHGFHGRTLGSLSATWKQEYREGFEPLVDGFEFVEFGDTDAIADAVDEDTAAVIIEPLQGEGGVNAATEAHLQGVRDVTDEVGAALVVDEIQTGLGRTGTMWACEQAGIVPDVLTTAKGLASGLPMGTTLCRDWVAEDAGDHGSTFSGGPVVCAAAGTTLDVIREEDLAANAAAVGTHLRDRLRDELGDDVRDIRGSGLLVGVEVKRGANRILRDLALDYRILALPAGRTVVRLLPPLTFEKQHADRVSNAMGAILA